jgi:sialate O-acetylesterase
LRKKEVAERVGLCFDRLVFNDKKVNLAPEVIDSQCIMDNGRWIINLTLNQPVVSGPLNEFELAGEDGRFVNVEATADGNLITIFSPLISDFSPQKVRYAWKDNPLKANVRSLTGLPMSSFELVINRKQ